MVLTFGRQYLYDFYFRSYALLENDRAQIQIMEFWTVTLVGLAAGLVLVIGGALVIYMGALVKSAYQLKIQIKSDVDDGLRRLEEEVEKKIRLVKRDLVEEVDKVKTAMQTDNQRKIQESLDGFINRLTACEGALVNDRTEAAKLFEALRNDVMVLDQRLRYIRREQKAAQAETAPAEEIAPTALGGVEPTPGAGETMAGTSA